MQYLGLDLIGCRRMPDRQLVIDTLGAICSKLAMTPLGQPQVEYVAGDKGGFTGSLIVTESHIVIHTFTNYRMVYCDIMSCKPFSESLLEATLQDMFLPQEVVIYPQHRRSLIGEGKVWALEV